MSDQITYAQLADRIAATLGERPSLSSLRAAPSRQSRQLRNRLTDGMPAPHPGPPGSPALFDSAEIDAWLAAHPRRTWPALRAAITEADDASARTEAVAAARTAGISWQAIADIISAADGTSWTRQGIQQKYGRRA